MRFGGTQYAKVVLKKLWGLPPELDMEQEKRVQAATREIVNAGLAESAHDMSDGGLAVTAGGMLRKTGAALAIELRHCGRSSCCSTKGHRRVLISTAEPEKVAPSRPDTGWRLCGWGLQ